MKLKKGDFVEIDYIAKDDAERVFDLTKQDLAEKEGIFDERHHYHPVIICIGSKDWFEQIENELEGKDVGSTITIDLSPEQAFGRRDPKLMQLVATNKLLKNKIRPVPGLQLNFEGSIGTIKSVSGGRTLVDFNHPLASRSVKYEITIHHVLEKTEEKVRAVLEMYIHQHGIDIKIENNIAVIHFHGAKELETRLKDKILALIPEVKDVKFESAPKEKTSEKSSP